MRATIAVTGMNANDNPGPGVAVVRSLRHETAFAGRIIGLGYDPLDAGFYAPDLLDGGAIMPYPSAGRDVFLARLRTLHAQFGFSALLPTLDSELRAVASLEPQLRAEGIGTFAPTLDSIERVSKPQLQRLGATTGVPVPESEAIAAADAIPKLIQRFGLPLVVKGVYYGAYVAQSESDALSAFRYFEATWGIPVVVQRFVRGDEYNVCALGDGEGNTIGAVAMRKLAVTDKGKGWAGVTVGNPALIALAESVIGALKWRGPLEVEVLAERDGDTERNYVIEINPRFPAWTYLTAAAGQNLPYVCALLALGAPAPRKLGAYTTGRMFVRIALDQIAELSTFGELSSTHVLAKGTRGLS